MKPYLKLIPALCFALAFIGLAAISYAKRYRQTEEVYRSGEDAFYVQVAGKCEARIFDVTFKYNPNTDQARFSFGYACNPNVIIDPCPNVRYAMRIDHRLPSTGQWIEVAYKSNNSGLVGCGSSVSRSVQYDRLARTWGNGEYRATVIIYVCKQMPDGTCGDNTILWHGQHIFEGTYY